MKIEKSIDKSDVIMPVIAALPYSISLEENEIIEKGNYNPDSQLTTHFSSSGSYSREDDSSGYWTNSKSDTKKDD